MQATALFAICFFHTFSGLDNVILTEVGSGVCSLRWNLGLLIQVYLSGLDSNALSYKWHPPDVFSVLAIKEIILPFSREDKIL
jgi:hypothetical protein